MICKKVGEEDYHSLGYGYTTLISVDNVTFEFPGQITVGLKTDEANCTWACQDLKYACDLDAWWLSVEIAISNYTNNLDFKIYHIGVILNFLLLVTLLSPTLKGSTFVFLRVVAVVQLCSGLLYNTTPYGLFYNLWQSTASEAANLVTSSNWFWIGCWYFVAKDIMMTGRFTVNVVSFFLTLERFLAVCKPQAYSKINPRKYFFIALAVSFPISLLEMEMSVTTTFWGEYLTTTDNITRFTCGSDPWGRTFNEKYLSYVIMTIKLFIAVCMLVFSCGIIVKLLQRGRQVASMMDADAAAKEYREMVSVCRFQMVDTVVMVLDVLTMVAASLSSAVGGLMMDYMYGKGITCSVQYKVYATYFLIFLDTFECTKHLSTATCHGELFIIYLIFFKKFRHAFVDVCKIFFGKAKQFSQRISGGTRINVVHVSPANGNVAMLRH